MMTFEDLSKQLNTSVQSIQNLVQVLSAAFADMEGGGSSSDYSSEEHVVGKWIDGSDVYEKSYIKTNISFSNSKFIIDADLKNVNILEVAGSVKSSGATPTVASLSGIGGVNEWTYSPHMDTVTGFGLFSTTNASAIVGGTCYCTIRYLK